MTVSSQELEKIVRMFGLRREVDQHGQTIIEKMDYVDFPYNGIEAEASDAGFAAHMHPADWHPAQGLAFPLVSEVKYTHNLGILGN